MTEQNRRTMQVTSRRDADHVPELAESLGALSALVTLQRPAPDAMQRLIKALRRVLACSSCPAEERNALLALSLRVLFEGRARPIHRQLLAGLRKELEGEYEQVFLEEFVAQTTALWQLQCGADFSAQVGEALPLAHAWRAMCWLRSVPRTLPACVPQGTHALACAVTGALTQMHESSQVHPSLSDDVQVCPR
jgi:hypothetical protein